MQRKALKSTQVVESCTSPVVLRTSPLRSVGRLDGGIVIATRFFPHLWSAMGSVSRISEWLPVDANRTAGPAALGADRAELVPPPPDAAAMGPAASARIAVTAQPATAADHPIPLLTA